MLGIELTIIRNNRIEYCFFLHYFHFTEILYFYSRVIGRVLLLEFKNLIYGDENYFCFKYIPVFVVLIGLRPIDFLFKFILSNLSADLSINSFVFLSMEY